MGEGGKEKTGGGKVYQRECPALRKRESEKRQIFSVKNYLSEGKI